MSNITKPASQSLVVHHHRCLGHCGRMFLMLMWLALSAAQAQTTNYALGTTALLVGPAAGSNSVVLAVAPTNGTWTATTNENDSWLYLSLENQSGAGSTNVVFSYDANSGTTRSGTLTIAGQTLTVTQAGATYVADGSVATLVSSGLDGPGGVAVDGAGNVYIADSGNNAIKKWTAASNTVTTLVSSGLDGPGGVAVDGAGNVYIADSLNGEVKKWTAANSNVTTLNVSLSDPCDVAVDGAGNVYMADTGGDEILKWSEVSNNVRGVVTSGLYLPVGVRVDGAGNIYIADQGNSIIKKWMADNKTLTTLVSSGLSSADGVAVDSSGNVYIADFRDNTIKKWIAVNGNLTTLVSSGLNEPGNVAVDDAGNLYIADTFNSAIKELPYAFVDPTPKLEGLAFGSDALPMVLPVTENLLPPFAPTSDQPWLTITGITNGVVSFSFTADIGPARTANITLLGQTIPITQGVIGTAPTLTGMQVLGNGVFQFAFTNTPGAAFTVVSTTDLSLPMSNWTVVGMPSNTAPGVFQFTSQPTTNNPQRFYSVRSP
jgi:sugar lactone lactonase YvrE